MDFKKRIKTRLYVGIAYIFLGIAMISITFLNITDNEFVSSFGLALALMGLVRIRNYFLITRNDEALKKQEIAETDERNISIINKARGMAFIAYIMIAALSVIVLALLGYNEIARWISYSVALLVAIYWVCYIIYRKIS